MTEVLRQVRCVTTRALYMLLFPLALAWTLFDLIPARLRDEFGTGFALGFAGALSGLLACLAAVGLYRLI